MGFETVLLNPATKIKIVGVNSYPAVATARVGDQVRISHEPSNPYDANAFRVDLVTGQQIGYLPAALAARIVESGAPSVFLGRICTARTHEDRVVGVDVTITSAA